LSLSIVLIVVRARSQKDIPKWVVDLANIHIFKDP